MPFSSLLYPLAPNLQPFHPRLQPLNWRLHLLHQYLHPFLRLVTRLGTKLGTLPFYRQHYRHFYRHYLLHCLGAIPIHEGSKEFFAWQGVKAKRENIHSVGNKRKTYILRFKCEFREKVAKIEFKTWLELDLNIFSSVNNRK